MINNGCVIFSKSQSIFRNLAFEDWLYRNIKCSKENCSFLLMWQNEATVVIGRHQNPWLECPVLKLSETNVELARRNSGGGTVFHDLGNLNLSFFTPRNKYNRDLNLSVICKALNKWNLNITVSPRHDLLWKTFKISGSASKLGRENAYHHCTLLLNVNHQSLINSLAKDNGGILSKATSSVRSSVENLNEVCKEINIGIVRKEIAVEYQKSLGLEPSSLEIDPNEEQFPGIDDLDTNLRSWDWIFGRTPRFTVQRNYVNTYGYNYSFVVTITNGRVEKVIVESVNSVLLDQSLIGVRFTLNDLELALTKWEPKTEFSDKGFIVDCIMRIARDVYS